LISVSVAPLSYFFCANACVVPDNTAAADTPPMNVRLLVFTDLTSHVLAPDFSPEIVAVKRRK
jgi:hypothetical protein